MMRRLLSAQLPLCRLGRCYTDAKTVRKPNPYDQLLDLQNLSYVESLLNEYNKNPASVDPTWIPVLQAIVSAPPGEPVVRSFTRPDANVSEAEKERLDYFRLAWMVRQYEKLGHHLAKVDPTGYYTHASKSGLGKTALDPSSFGFTTEDMAKTFQLDKAGPFFDILRASGKEKMTLGEITTLLSQMHCGSIGFEFYFSNSEEIRQFFRQKISSTLKPLSNAEKTLIMEDVVKACGFEQFLQIKYSTQQRFGLDGCEALIPAMRAALSQASEDGARSFIIGMAHRGRLNVLANVCGKPLLKFMEEFEGKASIEEINRAGDVKYHMGYNNKITLPSGNTVDVELLPNPSHLEAVNSLVLGKVRARQEYTNDKERVHTVPILIHGDAAFSGQGGCYETMGLCDLEHYGTGGTLHIIINNQIGFTADPSKSRSSLYCSDLAHTVGAPVMHVNADDVEACVRAARIAAEFRRKFHQDIILDLVCYRRNGHNEADLPDFTQPHLYEIIRKHPRLVDIYSQKIEKGGNLTADSIRNMRKDWDDELRKAHEMAQSTDVAKPSSKTLGEEGNNLPILSTGVPMDVLKKVGLHITSIPSAMEKPHPVVERTYAARKKAVETGDGAEWCLGELLALGTLALEGTHVRISGEDVERGTFTQRHVALTDSVTNKKYLPVNTISPEQAPFLVCNSSLSELGICGFEMGYNMENTKSIIIWEAQFGDFANGAQVIFDQFLGSSEEKWGVSSSLVLSLPHGYSGAGPEHSSSRVERFLQLSDDADTIPADFRKHSNEQVLENRIHRHNWQVCYPSTPANYFHMLRRQGLRSFAKPLVFFFSKARLRAPNLSSLAEMSEGTSFLPVIDTSVESNIKARKIIFCSGQIESIIADAKVKKQAEKPNAYNDVVLIKLEQLSPFPWEQVADVLEGYIQRNPNVEIIWLQEEPKNMGSWVYMRPRFNALLQHMGAPQSRIKYIGRTQSASPSTGLGSVHVQEENAIIAEVLS